MQKGSHIIIAGGGLSGLTLALELAKQPMFDAVQVSIIDRDTKTDNDRTWCFWARHDEPLPPVLHREWPTARFFSTGFETEFEMSPYRYCMVRGADFYAHARAVLSKKPNFRFLYEEILQIDAENGIVHTTTGPHTADWIFNSAFSELSLLPHAPALMPKMPFSTTAAAAPTARQGDCAWLLQHFKGWVIETDEDCFDTERVTLMDYRIEQHGDTRFVYVLPLSARSALVEYTVFSPALSSPEVYDAALAGYIERQLGIQHYRIEAQEFGIIPMSDYPFAGGMKGKVIPIGTVAGFVKASSGYAFLRTQRKMRHFVADWVQNGHPNPRVIQSPRPFRAMDSIMLHVLRDGDYAGKDFFTDLFAKAPSTQIFRFLDEDASFWDTLYIIRAAPAGIFLKKALRLFRHLWRV
jgi:lycopene beta-cyclase